MRLHLTFLILLTAIVFTGNCASTSSNSNSNARTNVTTNEISGSLPPGAPQPKNFTIDSSLNQDKAQESIRAARLYYGFWNTGDATYLNDAVSPQFRDNTLPKDRPQGRAGLEAASRQFRTAVPDLRCTIEDLLVVGDKVAVRLSFQGTFTGSYMGKAGTGKQVSFIAFDILRVENGRIVEDWHLEDNLTLMQQFGVVSQTN